jgi:Sulfotransferase family
MSVLERSWASVAEGRTDRRVLEGRLHDARRFLFRVVAPGHFRRYQTRRVSSGEKRSSYDCFDRTRSIFVHIPKAGGVSVAISLYGNRAGSHTSVSGYQLVFNAAEFQSYFKFTFVRNPWDRLYSAYRFLSAGGMNDLDRSWSEKHLAGVEDFEAFVLEALPRRSVRRAVHLRPQVQFLRNSITGKIGVDFVGRFERFDEDFATVAQRLGKDVSLPHMNGSRFQGDYRSAYSSRMRSVVDSVYAADINAFGYQF